VTKSSALTRHALFLAFFCVSFITSGASATDFAWLEDAAKLERGELKLSVGGGYYSSAPFPYSGLAGDLYEAPWIGLRYSASDNAQFYFNGAVRKFLTVDLIENAPGSGELEQPVELNQSRSATGDFSIYSKLRIPLLDNKLDLGLLTGFTMPNTNTPSGLGLDRNVIHGRAILGYSIGSVRLITNIGIAIIDNTIGSGQDDFFSYGFGAAVTPVSGVELHGEFYGSEGPPDGVSDGLFDSLNVALGVSVVTGNFSTDVTVKGFFKEPSPSAGVFIRFSRTFHLGRK
jgi:hypothetical protein